jgi:hypothetical protein
MRCRGQPKEDAILTADELLPLGELVIGAAQRIIPQAFPVSLVFRETSNVVDAVCDRARALVGCVVADQVGPATRNRLAPVAGILVEGIHLERVDLVADEAGDHAWVSS